MSREEDELLDTLLRLTGQPVPERPKPEPDPIGDAAYDAWLQQPYDEPDFDDCSVGRPQSPREGTAVATAKQIAFLRKLISERDGFDHVESGIASGLSKTEASALIEAAMKVPRRPRAPRTNGARRELVGPGYYAHDGDFYVVVTGKKTGRRYAKRLTVADVVTWEYAPGVMPSLKPEHRLTDDQVKAFKL